MIYYCLTLHKQLVELLIQTEGKYSWKKDQDSSSVCPKVHQALQTTANGHKKPRLEESKVIKVTHQAIYISALHIGSYSREKNNKMQNIYYYLNNMVSEINFFSLLSGSVLNIKDTDKVSSPASHQSIKKLKYDPR